MPNRFALKFLLFCLLASSAGANPEISGPLTVQANLVRDRVYAREPEDTYEGRGVRVSVLLHNTRIGRIRDIEIEGKFYNLSGALFHTDKQTVKVESKSRVQVYLFWSNPEGRAVDRVETRVSYQIDGKPYQQVLTLVDSRRGDVLYR